MVERRCAMMSTVRPCMMRSRASCTRCSLSASSALSHTKHTVLCLPIWQAKIVWVLELTHETHLVASSKSRILGFWNKDKENHPLARSLGIEIVHHHSRPSTFTQSWFGQSKATIHCRKLCVDTMDYIRCTCSTNQWLSHSLKINQEDYT